jgi:hypothetical protein
MRLFCSEAMWLFFFSCSESRGRSADMLPSSSELLRPLPLRRGFLGAVGDCAVAGLGLASTAAVVVAAETEGRFRFPGVGGGGGGGGGTASLG